MMHGSKQTIKTQADVPGNCCGFAHRTLLKHWNFLSTIHPITVRAISGSTARRNSSVPEDRAPSQSINRYESINKMTTATPINNTRPLAQVVMILHTADGPELSLPELQ